jgi:hypothetical protein
LTIGIHGLAEATELLKRDSLVSQTGIDIGAESDSLVVPLQRLVVATKRGERVPQTVAGIGVRRVQQMRASSISESFLEPVNILQRVRPHMDRLEIVGLELVAEIEVDESFLETFSPMQKQRSSVGRVPMLRIQLQRALKAQDRVGRTA